MDGAINYLNTDLDVRSRHDLADLAAILKLRGVCPLSISRGEDSLFYATFETEESYYEPEPNIAAMVSVIESLEEPRRSIWESCTQRGFNIGYDCGDRPWAFNQGLSNGLLGRIAAVGVSLRVTIYPDRE